MLTSLSKSLSKFKTGKIKLFETSYWYAKLKPKLEDFLQDLTKGISKNQLDLEVLSQKNKDGIGVFKIKIIVFNQTLSAFLKTEQNQIQDFLRKTIEQALIAKTQDQTQAPEFLIELKFLSRPKKTPTR